jgi:hypothetical protein
MVEDTFKSELAEANGQINTQSSQLKELKLMLEEKNLANISLSNKLERNEERLQQTVNIYEMELKYANSNQKHPFEV